MLKLVIFCSFKFLLFSQDTTAVTAIISNGNNRVTNFEISYIQEVVKLYNNSKKNKPKLKLNFIPHDSWIAAVKYLESQVSNDFILCINQVTITENWNSVEFSAPYLPIREALIMPKDNQAIRLSKDITVIRPNISTVPPPLKRLQNMFGFKIISYVNDGDWAKLLAEKKAQLLYGDNILLANNPDKLKLYDNYGPLQHLAIIFPPKSKLNKMLNPYIKYLTNSPKYYLLLKEHFNTEVLQLIRNELQKANSK